MRGILTTREKEVFTLLVSGLSTKEIVSGLSTKEIASSLNISEKTVRNHISNVMQKLGVKGRANAVIELLKLNEITL